MREHKIGAIGTFIAINMPAPPDIRAITQLGGPHVDADISDTIEATQRGK